MSILSNLLNLFYPRLCAACDDTLYRNEPFLCTGCHYNLPRTNFHKNDENDVAKIFWGRVPVQYATAFYHFQKGGLVQNLMHKLKYKGQKEIGSELGKIIGKELCQSNFNEVDVIVPVPLHKSKLRKRGYNQSECIAVGIAEAMNKPMDISTLYRAKANATQTRKHRFERWTNVESIFALKHPETIANKHILIVDDVVTTGATLEACANALLQAENVKVSIVTLAYA
ncbi:MAG: ComF family protein [Bacteroidota bacterium]|nr:ComF family protein [Bacteroidota bacterium]